MQGGSVGVHCCRHAAWQLGAEEVKGPNQVLAMGVLGLCRYQRRYDHNVHGMLTAHSSAVLFGAELHFLGWIRNSAAVHLLPT